MKIAIVGARGQLGTDCCQVFSKSHAEVIPLDIEELDVCSYEACHTQIAPHRPEIILNAAAFHHVEQCEQDPAKAFAVNALGARNLARLAARLGSKIAYISTDYVFEGAQKKPYLETDLPHPLNVYGNSKLSGELFVQSECPRHFVARVSGLYGHALCRGKGGLNFVQLMLKLAKEREEVRVVNDEFLTPTWTYTVAEQLKELLETEHYGLYHMTCQGECSWYQFAAKIFELQKIHTRLSIAAPNEFPAKVPRPKYSVLENRGLQRLNLDRMPTWEKALTQYFAHR